MVLSMALWMVSVDATGWPTGADQAAGGRVSFVTYDFADRPLRSGEGSATFSSLDPNGTPSLQTTNGNAEAVRLRHQTLDGAPTKTTLTVGAQTFRHWYDYTDRGLLWRTYASTGTTKPSTPDVTYTYTEISQPLTSGGVSRASRAARDARV
jgi:hypothetical protein